MDEPTKPPEPAAPEGNTEPVMLPLEQRDEAEETGTVSREEIDEMTRAKRKPKVEPPAPPVPPTIPVEVMTKQPPPLWFWVTFGVLVVAITVGLTYIWKARGRAAPGESGGSESAVRRRDPAGPRIA